MFFGMLVAIAYYFISDMLLPNHRVATNRAIITENAISRSASAIRSTVLPMPASAYSPPLHRGIRTVLTVLNDGLEQSLWKRPWARSARNYVYTLSISLLLLLLLLQLLAGCARNCTPPEAKALAN